jgi:hypothetical protein
VRGKYDILLNFLGIFFDCWVVFDFYEKPLFLVLNNNNNNNFGFTQK